MNHYNTLAIGAHEPEPLPTPEQLAWRRETAKMRDEDRRARGWSDEDFRKGWSMVDVPATQEAAR
jgi:hypothetical protein